MMLLPGGARKARARRRVSTRAAGIAGILVFLALGVIAVTALRGLPGRSYYEVEAQFKNASNLTKYAEVRVAGKRVGQVLGMTSRDGVAHVDLQLQPDTDIPADTRARIRLKGLLGAKFVELVPGRSAEPLPDGGTIPLSQTSTTVDVFDVLETFDRRGRRALQETVRGLGGGFLGRGDELNQSLLDSPPLLRDSHALAQAVNERSGAARRFFPSSESAAEAFEPVREDMAQGFDQTASALRPFVDGASDVQDTLEEAPSALTVLRRGLANTDPLTRETARWARASARLTRPAPAAFRATTTLLEESQPALRASRESLVDLAAAIPPAIEMSQAIDPLLEPSTRALKSNIPLLEPMPAYRCDILGQALNWRSMLAFGVESSGGILGRTTALRASLGITPHFVGDGPKAPESLVEQRPYPEPCTATEDRVE